MTSGKALGTNFNLDSFAVLLTGAYSNILISDTNLAKLEDFLMEDESLQDEEMTKTKMIELYRAMVARQKNNIQLLTQLISISNRNDQIKFLLEELTKIKEITNKGNEVEKMSPKAKALVAGIQKAMEDKYNESIASAKEFSEDEEDDEVL